MAFAGFGLLIVFYRPDNLVGWMMIVGGLGLVGFSFFVDRYIVCHLAGRLFLPATSYVAWFSHRFAGLFIIVPIFVLLPLLFPTGHFLTPRWRHLGNVQGRKPMSPLQGFGQLWQKTYRIRLEDITITPRAVIKERKAHFPEFWPDGNNFYGPLQGVKPGEVAVLNLSAPGGMKLSTGVRVIYADDESFSFMTPQGHMFAGMT